MSGIVNNLLGLPGELLERILVEAANPSAEIAHTQIKPWQQSAIEQIWKAVKKSLSEISEKIQEENVSSEEKGNTVINTSHRRSINVTGGNCNITIRNSSNVNQSNQVIHVNQGGQVTITGGNIVQFGSPEEQNQINAEQKSNPTSFLKEIINDFKSKEQKAKEEKKDFNYKGSLKNVESLLLTVFNSNLNGLKIQATHLQSDDLQMCADLFQTKFTSHREHFRNSLSPQRFILLAKMTSKLIKKIGKKTEPAIQVYTNDKIKNVIRNAFHWF